MGATTSAARSHDAVSSSALAVLMDWPLERCLSLNQTFRASGAGFMMNAVEVAGLLSIPVETASTVCKALSRNMKRDSVNVMTLLAVRFNHLVC